MNDNSQYALQRLLEYNIKYSAEKGDQPLVYLKSFGCQQNVSDGEKIKGMLCKVGYGFTDLIENAQLIIYNTCAVRENAEDRVFGTIGDLKHIKDDHQDAGLVHRAGPPSLCRGARQIFPYLTRLRRR